MSETTDEMNIAKPDDFFVTRNEDDELQPVTEPLPGVEESIRVIPMTMGDLNEYGGSEGQLNPAELSPEDVAEILNEHWYDVRESDDFDVTAERVEDDMIGFGRDALVTAILRASGHDLQNALNMENLEMLNEIDDPGKLKQLMDLANEQA